MPTRPWVTVVSGLPRSGTSMMMRMLSAGGIGPLMDGVREADPDNPRGYFELDAVKRTGVDAAWVGLAVGKAVKVIHLLVPALPDGFEYRVIFMHREMREVLVSQHVMLARLGRAGAGLPEARLAEVYARQVRETHAWMNTRPHFRVLDMRYAEVIASPAKAISEIDPFLGGGLDLRAMEAVVDPSLHRRHGQPT